MWKRIRPFLLCPLVILILSFTDVYFPGTPGLKEAAADEIGQADSDSHNQSAYRFAKGRVHAGFGVGVGLGLTVLGTLLNHDLVFGWAGAGEILTETLAEDKWYEGNVEFWGEVFGGFQYEPKTDYFAGLTPFIRYNLTAGDRIVPFIEAGAGLSLTDIEGVDLEGKFQFNLRGGIGMHYFLDEKRSILLASRFFHFSNGGLAESNRGLNALNFIIGYSWFF